MASAAAPGPAEDATTKDIESLREGLGDLMSQVLREELAGFRTQLCSDFRKELESVTSGKGSHGEREPCVPSQLAQHPVAIVDKALSPVQPRHGTPDEEDSSHPLGPQHSDGWAAAGSLGPSSPRFPEPPSRGSSSDPWQQPPPPLAAHEDASRPHLPQFQPPALGPAPPPGDPGRGVRASTVELWARGVRKDPAALERFDRARQRERASQWLKSLADPSRLSGLSGSGKGVDSETSTVRFFGEPCADDGCTRSSDVSRVRKVDSDDTGTGQSTRCRSGLKAFVKSMHFDIISAVMVVSNAAALGVQVDWQARHVTIATTRTFRAFEIVFCFLFVGELLLRIVAHGGRFFAKRYWKWHLFDCFLVTTQILEEVVTWAVGSGSPNLGVLRMMRILRLLRTLRLVRILRLIGELHSLVTSILISFKSLIWALLLLLLIMYVIGVYLTQVILDFRLDNADDASSFPELVEYYGSLGNTILSVYQAVTGGVSWSVILLPLRKQVSVWMAPLFMFYVALATFCILNVITGHFVDSALTVARREKDSDMVNSVRQFINRHDIDRNGNLTLHEFQKAMSSSELQLVLQELGIDASEADGLFNLLDVDDRHSITAEDFVSGCARLRGPARALELAILTREMTRQSERLQQHASEVDGRLRCIQHYLENNYLR